jgi:hypothetical protein
MPFKRKDDWLFPWEKEAEKGNEFIASISAYDAREFWARALRAVEHYGVLVVRYHNRPIGVVGSPWILFELLQERRAGQDEEKHSAIKVGLERAFRFAEIVPVETTPALSTQTMDVHAKPKSVVVLLRDTDAIAITYRQHRVRAFLVALPILAQAWTDRTQTEQLLAWMREVFGTIQEPMLAWR